MSRMRARRFLAGRGAVAVAAPDAAVGAAADPVPGGEGPVDRGLVTLNDAMLSGWFNNESDELYPGFQIGPDDTVVDVGCGDGGNLNFCASRAGRLIGVDIDEGALGEAGARTAAHAERMEFHTAPAERIPVPDGTASRVVCTEVLEHVADPAVVVAELVRIGASGARYLITVPDEVGEKVQEHAAPSSYFEHPNHIRVFRRSDFESLLSSAGLQVQRHDTYGFFWTIWWALFWEAGVDLSAASHPTLDAWTTVWRDVLETESGRALKTKLDHAVPKTQVIVAVKGTTPEAPA